MATPEQLAVCKRFNSVVVVPLAGEKLGIALNTLTHVPLHAVRRQIENGTCGWYLWGGEYSSADDFYQPMHVDHLPSICPQIIPYLALAPGWRLILAPDYEDVWFDEGAAP
jgi:hypothetical protein